MSTPYRFPAIYLSHGGGPWPFMELGQDMRLAMKPLAEYLRSLVSGLPCRPRATLMVSAHWEEPVVTLMTSPRPPMLYDYSGFPASTYELQWPAPGAPELAPQVRSLLKQAGFAVASNPSRGFDHGTFVPMMLALPNADLPVLQLSLLSDMDPTSHIAIGEALQPLREDGILLLGSGNSYHNMRGFGRASSAAPSKAFDDWVVQTVGMDARSRRKRLIEWTSAPGALACHPREEHLLPLHVMAGAAGEEPGRASLQVEAMAVHNTCVQFG
jgi:aromatic ring-opening dioxygenase catalytic subunit (LigB family)